LLVPQPPVAQLVGWLFVLVSADGLANKLALAAWAVKVQLRFAARILNNRIPSAANVEKSFFILPHLPTTT
jgi:hypothetical protein